MGVDDEQISPSTSLDSPEKSLGNILVWNASDYEDVDTDKGQTNQRLKKDLLIEEFDKNLPSTVQLLTAPNGSKVYLVGTAHYSQESQEDVSKVIQNVKPHLVMVELCTSRAGIMKMDEETIEREAKNISFDKIRDLIKENGTFQGLMYILILNCSARLTEEIGMAPGGEFRRALAEVKKLDNCAIQFGDRLLSITVKRGLARLSWWKTFKLIWTMLFKDEKISKEDLEKWKQRDLLESILAELAEEFPELSEVFLDERDTYLTYSLQLAAHASLSSISNGNNKLQDPDEPTRVVGIVGIGHMSGITRKWLHVTEDMITPLIVVPPRSRSSKVIGFIFKVAGLGLLCWGCYKLIPIPKTVTNTIQSLSVNNTVKSCSLLLPFKRVVN